MDIVKIKLSVFWADGKAADGVTAYLPCPGSQLAVHRRLYRDGDKWTYAVDGWQITHVQTGEPVADNLRLIPTRRDALTIARRMHPTHVGWSDLRADRSHLRDTIRAAMAGEARCPAPERRALA